MSSAIMLDGRSLSIAAVIAVARQRATVEIAPAALAGLATSRRAVEAALARGDTIYGVTTGFGKLAHVRIPPDKQGRLQGNLIGSHASGVGDPLVVDAVRVMMLLRANALLVHDASVVWRAPHAAAATTPDAVRGTPVPVPPRIHQARPHPFPRRSAA